jgi:hypothetical protein
MIKSDIPTHCLSHQITGNWVFYQTEAVKLSLKDLYKHKCGISDHTRVDDIMTPMINKKDYIHNFKIKFDKNHEAKIIESSNEDMFMEDKLKVKNI